MFAQRRSRWSTKLRSPSRSRGDCSRPQLESLEDRILLTAGDLDPSFGMLGKMRTDFIGPLASSANALAVQSDGKIVVAGSAGNDSAFHFALARFNPDGSLDPAFGMSGRVSTDFGTSKDGARAIAIQSDGKIVAVGLTYIGMYVGSSFAIARFNPNGSLDTTFGAGGKVIALRAAQASAVAIGSDGKIVVLGDGGVANLGPVVQLLRYNVDGSLDPTFGTAGKVTAPFGGTLFGGSDAAVLIQADGRIVVGGSDRNNNLDLARFNTNGSEDTSFGQGGLVTSSITTTSAGPQHIALQADAKIIMVGSNELARYNSDGTLDTSFGNGGLVTTPATPVSQLEGVTVQSDGKIVVAGGAGFQNPAQASSVVGRLNADGSVDSGFGIGGFATTFFGGNGFANAVAVLNSGKILAAGSGSLRPANSIGFALISPANSVGFALASYNPDGSPDTTFGQSGKVLMYFVGVRNSSANALALQMDGKILVVGTDFDIARYATDGSLDPSFGSGGRITTPFGAPGDVADGVVVQNDGKIVVVGRVTGLFALARYNQDGSLDTSFGVSGEVMAGSFMGEADGVVLQPDGRIVVVGSTDNQAVLARYNRDGSFDTSFGTGGKVMIALAANDSIPGAMVLQPDGKIIFAENTFVLVNQGHVGALSYSFLLRRYNSDGTADTTFGTNGQATYSIGQAGPFQGIALQADGRIVVVGPIPARNFVFGAPQIQFGVLRLLASGQVDRSFGTGGAVTTTFGADVDPVPKSVAIQADGKIVVAGGTPQTPGVVRNLQFVLARYAADGSLDSSFGHGGKVTTDFGDHMDTANAIALQPDGKIIAAGMTIRNIQGPAGAVSGFAVVRYLTDNPGTANQRFVEQLYWDLLRRPVDPSGLASWSSQLDQGVSRDQVAAAIQSSAEYHTLVVGDLYKLVLGRTVDASGLTTWVSFLNRGGTSEQLEAILLGSDEFFVAQGSDINHIFLPALYQIVLGRPIDSTGAQAWGQALQSGALSRQAVAAAVLASVESDRLELQSLYMQFLHRAADPGGLDTFMSALQRGVSDEQVALTFMGSAEYFSRV